MRQTWLRNREKNMAISLLAWRPWRVHVGVTVIELMVTLAIAVVMLTVAVPGFTSFIADNRRAGQANQVVGMLNMARSEAIKRGVRVTICKTSDPYASSPVCVPTATWGQGWVLFVDRIHIPGNPMGVVDVGDEILRVWSPDPEITLTTGGNYARGLYYDAGGAIRGINASGNRAAGNDTFDIASGGVKLCVVTNRQGRTTMRKQGEAAC